MERRRASRPTDQDPPGERAARARRAGAAALAAAALAGCQGYAPAPLEPEVHRAAWHGRTLEDATLAAFVERLDAEADGVAGFDPADGLSLDEGRLVALVFNPGLRLARLRVERAAATAEHAGLWDDPQLFAEVLRVTEGVPEPWVITPGLTFTIPVSGRLAVEERRADAALRAAARAAAEAEWDVWYAVAQAWVDYSAARLRVEETGRLVDAITPLVDTAAQLVRAGELPRTEAALFEVERAQRANQLRQLRGAAEAAEQRLRSLLGLSPTAPVTLVPALATALEDDPGAAEAPAVGDRHPTLARLREEYAAAEHALEREVRAQYPDLTLGPLAETDQGQWRVGLFGGLPLPVLNANRQAIAQARVDRELARAGFETAYELLVGRLAAARARRAGLAAQRADLEQVLVPLVDRQLEDALRLTRLGEGSSLVLLASLTRAQDTKLALIDARAAEALAVKEVEYLAGPSRSWPLVDAPAAAAQEDAP